MNWLVLLRPRAEADIAAARDCYDARRAGLGNEFLDEMAGALHELARNPEGQRFVLPQLQAGLAAPISFQDFLSGHRSTHCDFPGAACEAGPRCEAELITEYTEHTEGFDSGSVPIPLHAEGAAIAGPSNPVNR